MKKIIFGVTLILCSIIGISVLLAMAPQLFQSIGNLDGSRNIQTYWAFLGLTPFFHIFRLMGIVGVIICIIECLIEVYDKFFNQRNNKRL